MATSIAEGDSSEISSDEENFAGKEGTVIEERQYSTNEDSTPSSKSQSPSDSEQSSAYYEDSTSSESTSSSGSEQSSTSSNSGRSSKRKSQDTSIATSSGKRRKKSSYSDAYRKLLNENIQQAANRSVLFDGQASQSSQIGVSFWTAQEKEALFNRLGLFGKDDIQGLAAALRTKSEMEVKVYLQLLQEGLFEHNYREIRKYVLDPHDFPAAHELSTECCKALDQAADSLARRENNYDRRMEQEKWQDLWLLTDETSDWVEDCLSDGVTGETEVQEALPAAALLKLDSWLELSEFVFMNPASPNEESNWHHVAGKDERPSIYATAFSDFHTLAVSLTKRLIQATIFCAMSRLRAEDSGTFNTKPLVKRRDVDAATRILGLKANSKEFWIGAARRAKLDVYEKILVRKIRKGSMKPMTFEQVETALRNPNKSTGTDGTTPIAQEAHSDPQQELDVVADDSDMDINPTQPQFPGLTQRSSSPASSIKSESGSTNNSSDAEEEYLDAIDEKASLVEEQRLWAMLKRRPHEKIEPEDVEIPKTPTYERKQKQDLVDWRDRVDFQSEWEAFDKPVPKERWDRGTGQNGRGGLDEAQ